jgi:hypothetical protein
VKKLNRKLLTFSITTLLIALLAFNTQTAYSSLTASLPQPPALPNHPSNSNGNIINNSTLPDVLHSQPQTFEEQQLFWDFLNQVAGLDTSNYDVTRFRIIQDEVRFSQKIQTSISAALSNSQANLSIAMVLIEGKVRFYNLNLISGALEGKTLDISDSLAACRNAITQYRTNFNADYCTEFSQLIPITVTAQTDKLSIDNENSLLTVECSKEVTNQVRYTELCWYQKIGGLPIPMLSIQTTFAKTGLLTSFADNIGVYKVATTDIAITEADAIDVSLPIIEAYANANGRIIESIEAKLTYVSDYNGYRGDSFLVYPQWTITVKLDNSYKDGVDGYSVMIWGDSGEVHSEGAQGSYRPLMNSASTSYQYLSVLILVMTVAFIGVAAYKRRQIGKLMPKNVILRSGGMVIAIALSCSLFIAQPVLAAPSTICGSTHNIDQTEENLVTTFTGELSSWSSSIGYTAYNWYGPDTTANNLYIAAYDHGDMGSIVFYIGHGDDGTYCQDGYAISDDDGNWVSATDIYDNSVSQSSGHKKVAILWSCHQGETINQMPRAWLHTTSISANGYNSPDYSLQAFIGWDGEAPFIRREVGGVGQAGYRFLSEFYDSALFRGFDLISALDYAAQDVWSVNFDACDFYTGNGLTGNMVVYGQGTMYIGDEAYVSDVVDWASGYSMASGVFDPYNIEGGQNDGQFARIYAGNYGDFAWITGELNRQASGEIHLWAHTVSGYSSHLIVYVSNDYSNWYTTFNGYITNSNPYDINCGSFNNFRYIGICVIDDQGWSANLRVDAVHVSG